MNYARCEEQSVARHGMFPKHWFSLQWNAANDRNLHQCLAFHRLEESIFFILTFLLISSN